MRKGARIGGWLHGLAERRTEGRTSPRAQAVSALMMLGHTARCHRNRSLSRAPSVRRCPDCELTYLPRVPIDVSRAAAQHAEYGARPRGSRVHGPAPARGPRHAGLRVHRGYRCRARRDRDPDRPGPESRRAESDAVAEALQSCRPRSRASSSQAPWTAAMCSSPGDRSSFGCFRRTNAAAIDQMRELIAPLGYDLRPVSRSRLSAPEVRSHRTER